MYIYICLYRVGMGGHGGRLTSSHADKQTLIIEIFGPTSTELGAAFADEGVAQANRLPALVFQELFGPTT